MSSVKPNTLIPSLTRKITPIPRLVRVTLVKSPIKATKDIKDSLHSLGLGRLNSSRTHKNISSIRGMISTAKYYVTVEDVTFPLPEYVEKPSSILDNPPLTEEIPRAPGTRTEPFPMEEMFPKKSFTLQHKVVYPFPKRAAKVIDQFNQIKQEFENNNTQSSPQDK